MDLQEGEGRGGWRRALEDVQHGTCIKAWVGVGGGDVLAGICSRISPPGQRLRHIPAYGPAPPSPPPPPDRQRLRHIPAYGGLHEQLLGHHEQVRRGAQQRELKCGGTHRAHLAEALARGPLHLAGGKNPGNQEGVGRARQALAGGPLHAGRRNSGRYGAG